MSQDDVPGLDLESLRHHLDQQRPGLVSGDLHAEVIQGGRSNLTYLVSDARSRWVVRRPPLGHVLPTAHDMSREYRVIRALHGDGRVPAPPPVLLCEDPEVLGAAFYVMEFVTGTPFRSAAELEAIGPERTRRLAEGTVDALVELHSVDPTEVGLADFGRPEGYLARQVARWRKQLDASHSRDLPDATVLHERLAVAVPASPPATIVHGDFRLDNLLVDTADRVTAVLDWEMSTLGDPLTDLALLVAYDENARLNPGIGTDVGLAPGYPSADALIARYAAGSGRDVSALGWYVAFALYKLAVIVEGIHYRHIQGQTVGAGFDRFGGAVGPLLTRALDTLKD
ncbi:Predicted kinase, aminoglycoside phosphotransferase (APT) family [Pseudonocardia ammonioxydans]|uniref:Predicted kinase, aminoglycoside phosphotransferase (APT) family n=1 Tax=Pseudonocardia ammonioxydans TaxID=260086 RepID=A0A1I5FVJ2_PSUAM|nr:phosphotransferase family protein [Pseudonocardia ammonioxydans]SFO27824.1 Predicted kinase, aminoglycoside phosphotransferase (APT) family [Pseudonocardia ammonioxydans]